MADLLAIASELRALADKLDPPAPAAPTWAQASAWTKPAPAGPVVDVSTLDAFFKAYAACKGGERIVCHGLHPSGEVKLDRQFAAVVEIDWNDTLFQGTASGTRLPAVWVNGAANHRMFGGDITCKGNQGILVYDAQSVAWWGWKVHDCAGTGVMVQGINRAATGLDLAGEVANCGLDQTLDVHSEVGTGAHGVYFGGSDHPVDGRFAFDVHDQAYGAAVEVEVGRLTGSLAVRARRIMFNAQVQVAGNALQLWDRGGPLAGFTVPYLAADTLAGRAVDCNTPTPDKAYANVKVAYARTTNALLNPKIDKSFGVYDNRRGVAYGDVA